MGRSGSYINSSITSAWSEHSLDPEDIRVRQLLKSRVQTEYDFHWLIPNIHILFLLLHDVTVEGIKCALMNWITFILKLVKWLLWQI